MPGALSCTPKTSHYSCPKSNLSASHLKIVEGLQTGGSGTVYLAEHLQTGKNVAVKIVPFRSKKARERFFVEADIALRMSEYDSVVTTSSCFTDGACGCLVMEALESDLLQLIPELEGEEQLKKLFHQVVEAVAQCHKNSIAHLDIKPENVLIDSLGNAKLCDFGFACDFDADLHHRTGTVLYNAPEVSTYGFDKAAADVWSLGVLLYVLLTGNFPYPGDTEEEVMHNKDMHELFFDDLVHENRSDEACSLVRSILQLDPLQRPTAEEILSHPWFHL